MTPLTRAAPKTDRDGNVRCRVCGCTEIDACPVGCSWADGDLCSVCFEAAEALRKWREQSRRANLSALLRESEFTATRAKKASR
jgi:hypothetical protein